MLSFTIFIVALMVTVALIPPLMRLADRIGVVDLPNERKIHAGAIPRIGGIAMVIGVILPVILWLPIDRQIVSLLLGAAVLFVFGVWDDRGDLDYRIKFIGQLLAVLIVVIYGNVTVSLVPMFGLDPVSPYLSIPLTVFFLVGVTNAINLADGLDGLAAGTTLLTLGGVALLAFLSNDSLVFLFALAVAGVLVGFLRYNTFPARVFMGDTGSQFLGFTVAALTVMLTQRPGSALNPAIPLLLLGLPIFDTVFVILKRIYNGVSPFSPDKNHIHHQLLNLDFDHYEAVAIVYLVQGLFVASAVAFRYQSDLFVLVYYVALNLAIAGTLLIAGRMQWRAHNGDGLSLLRNVIDRYDRSVLVRQIPLAVIRVMVPAFLVVGAVYAHKIPVDIGAMAAFLFVLLVARMIFGYKLWFFFLRLLIYLTVAIVVYLTSEVFADTPVFSITAEYIFYGLVGLSLLLSVHNSKEEAFRVTPTDLLILLVVIGAGFIQESQFSRTHVVPMVVKIIILFYASELALKNMASRLSGLTVSAMVALAIIASKSLLFW